MSAEERLAAARTSAARKKGLGRGLDILLGGSVEISEAIDERASATLPLARLQPGKYQPRAKIDPGALQELAASIRAQGLMQPILVRPAKDGHYEIIAGERRYQAAQLAGLDEVPVLVKDVPDQAAAAMALIENIQREDLNPLEEARGVQRLIDEFGLTHEQAAQAVGRSRSALSNLLRLLKLAQPVQTMLLSSALEMGHARALLAVDAAMQITLANQIAGRRLSVRAAEKLVAAALNPAATARQRRMQQGERDIAQLEEELSDTLAAPVKIRFARKGHGQLMIDFKGLDALEAIIVRLRADREPEKSSVTLFRE